MSRRRRRVSKGSGAGSRGGARLGVKICLGVLGLIVVGGVVGYNRVLAYIHSDQFSETVGVKVGDAMGAQGEFGNFEWSGMHGRNDGFVATSDGALVKLEGEKIQLDVGVNFVKRDEWKLKDVQVGRGYAEVDLTKDFNAPVVRDEAEGMLEKWLPKKARLVNAEVIRGGLLVKTRGGDYRASGIGVNVEESKGGGYVAKLSGGEVALPYSFLGEAELLEGELRFFDHRLYVDQGEFSIFGNGSLSLDGEVDFNEGSQGYSLNGVVSGLTCADVISPDWRQKLKGDVSGRFSVKPGRGKEPMIRGYVEVRDGVLTALPMLDSIAAFTLVRDFKALKFSKFSCQFVKHGELLELSDIQLHCDRLLRVEGYLTLRGEKLDGRLEVGLMPGTLRHIPGAEEKIFLRGKDGMSWASVKIGGTLDDVEEDLTDRMIAAAGERMFEMVGGKQILKFGEAVLGKGKTPGGDVIKDGGEKVIETGKEIFDAGKDVLDGKKDPIRAGADVLEKGLGGIFGGGSGGDDDDEEEEE